MWMAGFMWMARDKWTAGSAGPDMRRPSAHEAPRAARLAMTPADERYGATTPCGKGAWPRMGRRPLRVGTPGSKAAQGGSILCRKDKPVPGASIRTRSIDRDAWLLVCRRRAKPRAVNTVRATATRSAQPARPPSPRYRGGLRLSPPYPAIRTPIDGSLHQAPGAWATSAGRSLGSEPN